MVLIGRIEHILVGLVADDPQAMLFGDGDDRPQGLLGQHCTSGIVGRVQKDGLGAGRDVPSNIRWVVFETLLEFQRNAHGHATRELDVLHHFGPHGVGHDDFIAIGQEAAEGDE